MLLRVHPQNPDCSLRLEDVQWLQRRVEALVPNANVLASLREFSADVDGATRDVELNLLNVASGLLVLRPWPQLRFHGRSVGNAFVRRWYVLVLTWRRRALDPRKPPTCEAASLGIYARVFDAERVAYTFLNTDTPQVLQNLAQGVPRRRDLVTIHAPSYKTRQAVLFFLQVLKRHGGSWQCVANVESLMRRIVSFAFNRCLPRLLMDRTFSTDR